MGLSRLPTRIEGIAHEANSRYTVTLVKEFRRYDCLVYFASYDPNQNPVVRVNYQYENHIPRKVAFSETFWLVYRWSKGRYVMFVSPMGILDFRDVEVGTVSSVAMRDVEAWSQYAIYYSVTWSDNVYVYIKARDRYHISQWYRSKNIGPTNCANKIQATQNIVVVSCVNSEHGKLSIFRESDMTLYKEISSYFEAEPISLRNEIFSSGNYHQVYVNFLEPNSLCKGELSVIEIFTNLENDYFRTNLTTVSFQSGYSIMSNYSKYIYLDKSNANCISTSSGISGCQQHKLYIGGIQEFSDRRHAIDVVPICTNPVDNQTSDSCYSPSDRQFTSFESDLAVYDDPEYCTNVTQ